MKFENNRQNGDAVKKAASTPFTLLGSAIVPDGLGTYIPYNGKNLIKFTAPSTGTFTVGETVTGGTSTATGTVVSVNTGSIVITPVSGTFVAGETVTGGSSSATGVVSIYYVRNKIYGFNTEVINTTDTDYAVSRLMGVSTPVKIMDKLLINVSSANATAALVGNYVNVDPAAPDSVTGTAVAFGGMIYVTDFIDASTVMGLAALVV